MEAVLLVIGGAVGLAIGLGGGLWLGAAVRGQGPWLYWLLNAVVLILGIAGNFFALQAGQMWIVVGILAFIGGGLTGLKYGYGRSVGVWRVHDRAMGSDDLPRG